MSNETKSKEVVTYELYVQIEKQLIEAIDKADKAVQEAQSNRTSIHAQLAMIRKVNEKVEQYLITNPTTKE